jgi:hypothetical protein
LKGYEKEVLQALNMTDEDEKNDETVEQQPIEQKEENLEELPKMIDNEVATSVSKIPVADSDIVDDTISIF